MVATVATPAKRNGFTPLLLAARTGKASVVKELLKVAAASGADLGAMLAATSPTGLTPLALAQTNKREDVVMLLNDAAAAL